MTAGAATGDGLVQCWCCDARDVDERMVRLGDHPEVAVCVPCAHALSTWASAIEDRDRTGPLVAAREVLRTARAGVIRRGWHRRPLIGRGLRWLGRYLP